MITMATYFEGIEIGEEATIRLLCQFSKRIFDSLLLAIKIIPLTYRTSGYPGYSWARYLHTATAIARSDVILFVYVTFRTIHELIFMNNRKSIESDSRSRSSLSLLKNPVILLTRITQVPRYLTTYASWLATSMRESNSLEVAKKKPLKLMKFHHLQICTHAMILRSIQDRP